MRPLRVIGIGIIIWIIGVSLFTLSFYIPLLDDAEKQANTVLLISVPLLVWLGSKQYFKKGSHTSGYTVGLGFFLTSMTLDAAITVPVFIIPNGGSYHQFFTDIGFWLIGLEFLIVATLYRKVQTTFNNKYQVKS
jgi:hypothetical protein